MRLTNYSEFPFAGWLRLITTRLPANLPPIGEFLQLDGSRVPYRVGDETGMGRRELDLLFDLAPMASEAVAIDQPVAYHADEFAAFGGDRMVPQPSTAALLRLGSATISLSEQSRSGSFTTTHWRGRIGAPGTPYGMIVVDVWAQQADRENWARVEVVLTCSDPDSPAMVCPITTPVVLTADGAFVILHGRSPQQGGMLLEPGESLAEGQGSFFSGVLFREPSLAALAWSICPISAVDQDAYWNPALGSQQPGSQQPVTGSGGVDMVGWMRQRIGSVVGWRPPWTPLMPILPNSGSTGGLEDQGFAHLEFLLAHGQGAEIVRYFACRPYFFRPCHFRERDGSPILPENHPDLGMWNMLPDPRWSTDMLGKPRQVTANETQGWLGSDHEHMWFLTLCESAMVNPSPALQQELEITARNWLFQVTVDPRMATTRLSPSARTMGCVALTFCHLYWALRDRTLADQVMERMRAWLRMLPLWPSLRGDLWDIRRADARHGVEPAPYLWIAYQQAFGAAAMWLAARLCGDLAALTHAMRGVRACVRLAWPNGLATEHFGLATDDPFLDQTDSPTANPLVLPAFHAVDQHEDSPTDGQLRDWARQTGADHGVDDFGVDAAEILTSYRTGWFQHSWMPPALWTAIVGLPPEDPDHQLARQLWTTIGHPGGTGLYPWILPLP